jgi:hypothetical protein
MWHRGKVHEWTSGAFSQGFRLIHMPHIIVLVKQVPDTNAKIVVSGDRVDLSSVKMVMSPYDEFAVETALQHREASGGEVTALTVGGPGAEKILKDAKAIVSTTLSVLTLMARWIPMPCKPSSHRPSMTSVAKLSTAGNLQPTPVQAQQVRALPSAWVGRPFPTSLVLRLMGAFR